MKAFFTTFFCTIFLLLYAQQKAPLKKAEIKSNSKEVINTEVKKDARIFSHVIDEKGNPIANVQVRAIDDNNGQMIATAESEKSGLSIISVSLDKEYTLVFSKPEYFFQLFNVAISDSSGYEKNLKDITLNKMDDRKKFLSNTVFFELKQSTMQEDSILELDRMIKLMNDIPSLQIEISGLTDNIDSLIYNRQFSEQRAKDIMDTLISKGCDKNRLSFIGYESSQPIINNNIEDDHKLNYRIELTLIKVDPTPEVHNEEDESGDELLPGDGKTDLAARQAEQEQELEKMVLNDSIAAVKKANLVIKEAEAEKAKKDSIETAHKVDVAAKKAEQEQALEKMLIEDSIATADKAYLVAKEKDRTDSIASADKANEVAKKAEQEQELASTMRKDSIASVEKANLIIKEAEMEKLKKDSIETAYKADMAAKKAEQEQALEKMLIKDSIAAVERANMVIKEAEAEKAKSDSIEAAHKADMAAKKADVEAKKAEQEQALEKMLVKDSIAAAEKNYLAEKEAEAEKAEKDSIETAHKADVAAKKAEQEQALEKMLMNDSIAAAEKAYLLVKEKERTDSIASADKANEAAKKAEQEQELARTIRKDSIAAAEKNYLAEKEAEAEKAKNDSIEAAHKVDIAAKKADMEAKKAAQEQELENMLMKDSIAAVEKANMAINEAEAEKAKDDSIEAAHKADIAAKKADMEAKKAEQEQALEKMLVKDSIATALKNGLAANELAIEKAKRDSIEAARIKIPIPKRFKKYDKNDDGLISYDEVQNAIDSFFDEDPNAKGDQKKATPIYDLLDYYFDQ